MIDIVVLNYNDALTTIDYINRMKLYKSVRKIVVIDNCSTDDSVSLLNNYQDNKIEVIVSPKNGGYGSGNNLGIRYLYNNYKSKYILLSNPDVIVEEDTIQTMESFLRKNLEYAVVAPWMLNTGKEKQFNTAFKVPEKKEYILSIGMLFSKFCKSFYYHDIENESGEVKDVGCVSGSMFLMDADKMMRYGMYDENIFLYCEEVVLGLRLKRAKQKVALLPQEYFIHNHSVSINKSFKKLMDQRKLLLRSKLYVIKNYYDASFLEYKYACFLAKISLLETRVLAFFRRHG